MSWRFNGEKWVEKILVDMKNAKPPSQPTRDWALVSSMALTGEHTSVLCSQSLACPVTTVLGHHSYKFDMRSNLARYDTLDTRGSNTVEVSSGPNNGCKTDSISKATTPQLSCNGPLLDYDISWQTR